MARSRSKQRKERQRASARSRAEQRSAGGENSLITVPDGYETFKLDKEGTKRIELLDYVVGDGNPYADAGMLHYERTYFIHKSVGAGDGKWIVCPAKTFGKKCPICEHRSELGSQDDADEDMVKALLPKERQLFLIFDHDEPDKGAQVWEISYHLFGKILDAEVKNTDPDDLDEYADISSWEDGKTVRMAVEEDTYPGGTFYKVTSVSFKDRRKELPSEVIEQAENICLDDMLKEMHYDELKKLFYQVDDDDDDDDKEEKKTTKRRRTRSSKKDDDEEESPKEEPKEEPKKGRGRKSSSSKSTSSKSTGSRRGSTRSKKEEGPSFEEGDEVRVVEDPEDEWEGKIIEVRKTDADVEDEDGKEWAVGLQYLEKLDSSDDNDGDDEEEEEEKPKSRSRSRSSKKEEAKKEEEAKEEDDDDDDWDDDWED